MNALLPQENILLGSSPLCDIDAEMLILGSIIIDPTVFVEILAIVSAQDFYRDAHIVIFQTLVNLFENNSPIETKTLAGELESQNKFDKVGGYSYLVALMDTVVSCSTAPFYARKVANIAARRRVQAAARDLILSAQNLNVPLEQLESQINELISNIQVQTDIKERSITPLQTVTKEVVEGISNYRLDPFQDLGIRFSFSPLDGFLPYIPKKRYIGLVSKEGIGKSAFCLFLCRQLLTQGRKVRYVTLEMPKEDLTMRLFSSLSGLTSDKIGLKDLNDFEFEKLKYAEKIMKEWRLDWVEPEDRTIEFIIALLLEKQRVDPADFVVIDHWALCERINPSRSPVENLDYVSRKVQAYSQHDLSCPIILLTHLNREGQQQKEPELYNIAGSSSMGRLADVVIFLQDTEKGVGNTRELKMTVKKHKNGRKGFEIINFDLPTQTFEPGGNGIGGTLLSTGF